jgi:prepilin-type N-terminal cleavage/methylation domain-containing protein
MTRSGLVPRNRSGFTLIELAVTLVVVAVLASIATVNYNKVRVHAEAAALSHDIHLLEDAIVRGIIEGNVSPTNAPKNLAELEALLPGDQALLQPRLPEGMSISFNSVTGQNYLLILIRGQPKHKPILDALAAIRPLTTQEVGTIVMEALDYRTLVPETPAQARAGGGG